MLKVKAESVIRQKYEKELRDAEQMLFDYKERQLANVRNVFMRKGREGESGLMQTVVESWNNLVLQRKRDGDTAEAMKEIEAKLAQFAADQAENTKRVMQRMGCDQDATLINMTFQSWVKFSIDYKKDKEFEDQVKLAEKLVQEHMAKKKDEAKTVLNRMNAQSDTGLVALMMQHWNTYMTDLKQAREMEEKMGGGSNRFKSLQDRQLGNARGVQGRVNEQININLSLRCFCGWFAESKLNKLDKYYQVKMDGKRKQLHSVQTLFKSFAKQLEEGLGSVDGESSGRHSMKPGRRGILKGGEGSVSLPEINAK